MTSTSLRRIAYGLMALSLAFIFLSVQRIGNGTPATRAATPLATPAPTPAPTPTLPRYNCGDSQNPDYLTFNWTSRKPNGGWVGDVSYGANFVKKPIQVFDAKVDPTNSRKIDWAFQA